MGAHPPSWPLEPARVKIAVLVAGATATHNSPFSSLAVAVTVASTHCAYPRTDGQAELAWVVGYVVR